MIFNTTTGVYLQCDLRPTCFLGAAYILFSFQLPVCYAIICVPTRKHNNEFVL